MLGHSHALSGLAVGAATLPWAPVQGAVAQVAWVSAVGGFSMLPDLDQHGSTISRMWGPLTDVPSRAVGAVAGGHRWGTHDALLAPVVFGLVALAASGAWWSSLLLLALAVGLALRALHFVIPGRAENTVIGNLALSWGSAWLLLEHSPNPAWLPWAVAVGVLAHIAGDALTTAGVPVPLVWLVRRCRLAISPMRTGARLETAVLAPAFLVATLALLYVNTPAGAALTPVVEMIDGLG
ncbi:metal-dependent hydrolase [Modestobacter sp. I12A-02628]|uniref:Metal-dependent hydrolase n=1 Tax=Goekera deserti TaxID=2497753 RepID=A0A7K3W7Z9_9ACTN|nr:metal-dependent hydrolase [Goekera deserti]MPQ99909.1 metal-dependent hydrolase [Goekera deserti]NDI50068.1 metal-dependent hydrolase [Goekera deserti]NEL52456.1 metal-dependent hydrolase [Goekera deserti]